MIRCFTSILLPLRDIFLRHTPQLVGEGDASVNFNSICFILAVSNSTGYCFKNFQRNVFPEICPLKAKRNTRDTFSKLNRILIHR